MSTYLRQFDVHFECVGPVFIGSGEKRTSKEYVQVDNRVYFPEMADLYSVVTRLHKADAFESFVLNDGAGQGASRLRDWLERNGFGKPLKIEPLHRHMGGYTIPLGPLTKGRGRKRQDGRTTNGQENRINDIHTFVKDAYGRPYIPGSSVKGLLRSLYLQYMVTRPQTARGGRPAPAKTAISPERPSSPRPAAPRPEAGYRPTPGGGVRGRTGGHSRPGWPNEQTELEFLRRAYRPDTSAHDAVNDLFQAIRVSDSSPLPLDSLRIIQKVDRPLKGDDSGMPLYRECIASNTSFAVRVVVDTSAPKVGGFPQGVNFLTNLASIASSVNHARYADYAAKFMGGDPLDGPYVYLGGGAGYRSKTIVTDQAQMADILDGQFNRGRYGVRHKRKTEELGVSPLTLKIARTSETEYDEMGQCRISVQEVDG